MRKLVTPPATKKTILVLSDLHCGSIFGLLPPGVATSDGRVTTLNAPQEYLWWRWDVSLPQELRTRHIDYVVVNGDVIDGRQDKRMGTELALPVFADQAAAAEIALRQLRKKAGLESAQWLFIQGTEYHDGCSGREVEVVARALSAARYTGLGVGYMSHEVLDLEPIGTNTIINFAHGTSVATGFYRTTPADREGIWSALAGKEGKMPKADAVVRAHAHNFVHVEHASKHIVIGPCWQLQTRYMRRHSVYRMIPDIGVFLLHVDGKAKLDGRDPIRVEKILYDLPPMETVKL